jgi:two-component system LytT family sensor kinase
MRNQWYTSRWAVVSFHILVWLLLFSFPVLFHHDNEHGENFDCKKSLFNSVNITLNISWVIIFYFNAHFLIPRFLNKRRNWAYFISICSILILFLGIMTIILAYSKWGHPGFVIKRDTFFFIFPFLFIWAMSTVYRIVSDKVKTDQLLKER